MAIHTTVTCDRCGEMAPPEVVWAMVDETARMASGWLKVTTERSVDHGTSGEILAFCQTCALTILGDLRRKSKEPCPECPPGSEPRTVTPSFIDPESMTLKRLVKCPDHGRVVVWRSE